MPPEQNQLPTLNDIPADLPTHDDGGYESPGYTPPAQPQPSPQGQQEQGEAAESHQWTDNKRNEIFSRAREKRATETQPFSGDVNDPEALYGTDVNQDDMGELEKEALRRRQEHINGIAQPQQGQQGQQSQRKPLNGLDPQFLATPVPVIVDGEQRAVPLEDLVRNYQIDQAAQRRLEQAKALLAQTQEFQRLQPQPGNTAGNDETSGQDDSHDGTDDFDRELGHTSQKPANVRDLIEKIQLGSPDEAAQALEDFVTSAVQREPPVDEQTRVLTALEDHNAKQAVIAFAQANPQIANNPVLQQEATKVIHRNMAEDLLRAGYTMDELRSLAPSPQHLTQLHKQARISGVKGVRRVSDLISAGYQGAIQNLRTLVEQTAPAIAPHQAPSMAQRQQRKDTLQPQPAARRMSPSLNAPAQSRTQDQSRSAAVQRMRQARGQSV